MITCINKLLVSLCPNPKHTQATSKSTELRDANTLTPNIFLSFFSRLNRNQVLFEKGGSHDENKLFVGALPKVGEILY